MGQQVFLLKLVLSKPLGVSKHVFNQALGRGELVFPPLPSIPILGAALLGHMESILMSQPVEINQATLASDFDLILSGVRLYQ